MKINREELIQSPATHRNGRQHQVGEHIFLLSRIKYVFILNNVKIYIQNITALFVLKMLYC